MTAAEVARAILSQGVAVRRITDQVIQSGGPAAITDEAACAAVAQLIAAAERLDELESEWMEVR